MCSPKNKARRATLYSRLVARLYDPFMDEFERRFLIYKRQALLNDIRGRVLEVGAGTGINFPLYEAGVDLVAIEPSGPMLEYARRKMQQPDIRADIRLVKAGIGDETVAHHLPPGGFDAVVCTLVLCTIPDPAAALQQIRDWLAPNGRLYVLEHIAASRPGPLLLQKLVNPFWRHLAEGCNLTRRTDWLLAEVGFVAEWEDYFSKSMPFYQAILKKNK